MLFSHRLEKPQYADDRLYDVMKRCWEQKPTARPNFSQLQEILGSFLEDNVRNVSEYISYVLYRKKPKGAWQLSLSGHLWWNTLIFAKCRVEQITTTLLTVSVKNTTLLN